MNEKRRFVELDALRGIAAMAVVLFHYTSRFGEVFEVEGFGGAPFQYGHLGVHLFFVISGYVIFLTISKCRTGRDFLVSRFSRLYPVYWGAMLVTILVAVFSFAGTELRYWPDSCKYFDASSVLEDRTDRCGLLDASLRIGVLLRGLGLVRFRVYSEH